MKYCPETAWALTLAFGIIGGLPSEPFVYEARYGWNRRTGLVIIAGLAFTVLAVAFTVLAVALPGMSLAMRIFVIVLLASELLQQAVRAEVRRQDLLNETDAYLAELLAEVGEPSPEEREDADVVARRIASQRGRKAS